MLNKKAFTFFELLISLSVISIIFISFPTILNVFVNTAFNSENQNKQNLNRLYKDIKESYLITEEIEITDNKLELYRYDNCVVIYDYNLNEKRIYKSIECNIDFEKKELNFVIENIDFFKIEKLPNKILKIEISSKLENFKREFLFNKL